MSNIPKHAPGAGSFFSFGEKFAILGETLGNKSVARRTLRDATYLFIDSAKEIKLAHKSYGDFIDYIKLRGRGKNLSEERMDDLDLEMMRRQLQLYHQAKNPLTSFDLRWFYYLYGVWFIILIQGGWQAYQRRQAYKEMLGSDTEDLTIEQRRKKFGAGYIEDVRVAS
jgi:hypothetical protein